MGLNIWLYTGYTFEQIMSDDSLRRITGTVDTIVDGPFISSLRDTSLLFRGSSNQRILNMPAGTPLGKRHDRLKHPIRYQLWTTDTTATARKRNIPQHHLPTMTHTYPKTSLTPVWTRIHRHNRPRRAAENERTSGKILARKLKEKQENKKDRTPANNKSGLRGDLQTTKHGLRHRDAMPYQ